MAAFYWVKLYDEMLDDPKMGRLSDGAFRMFINSLLLASRQENRDGRLPDFDDMAWHLRISINTVMEYWQELERASIGAMVDGRPHLINFAKRQAKVTAAERMKKYRERKKLRDRYEDSDPIVTRSNENVTKRNTDIDKDKEIDNREEYPPYPPEGGKELEAAWSEVCQLIGDFQKITGIDTEPFKRNGDYKQSFIDNWVKPIEAMRFTANGQTAELMREAVITMTRDNLDIGSPKSIRARFMRLARQQSQPAAAPEPDDDYAAEMAAIALKKAAQNVVTRID